jgi:hypothetical protein
MNLVTSFNLVLLTTCTLTEAFVLPTISYTFNANHYGELSQQFSFSSRRPLLSKVLLGMGKGLNKARNKQGELARRLELAKQQRENSAPDDQKTRLSDEEIKIRNDRQRFEEMLRANVALGGEDDFYNYDETGKYLSSLQSESNGGGGDGRVTKRKIVMDRLLAGDAAPVAPFEELVSISTENALGTTGASRLVPWLRKNEVRRSEYLVILCDPRPKSKELRTALQQLSGRVPPEILSRTVVINADSPAENRRWIKKNDGSAVDIYSDEKLEWMRSYTALGEQRWSMSLFVIADERIQKVAREIDVIQVDKVIVNAIKSL